MSKLKKILFIIVSVIVFIGVVFHFTLGTGYASPIPLIPNEYIHGIATIKGKYMDKPFEYSMPYECIDTMKKNSKFSVIVADMLKNGFLGQSLSEIDHNIFCSRANYLIPVGDEIIEINVGSSVFPYQNSFDRRVPVYLSRTYQPYETNDTFSRYDDNGGNRVRKIEWGSYTITNIHTDWLYNQNNEADISILPAVSGFEKWQLSPLSIFININKDGARKQLDVSTTTSGTLEGSFDGESVIQIENWLYHPLGSGNTKTTDLELMDEPYEIQSYFVEQYTFRLSANRANSCRVCQNNKNHPFCGDFGSFAAQLVFNEKVSPVDSVVHFTIKKFPTFEYFRTKPPEKSSKNISIIKYNLDYVYKVFNSGEHLKYTRSENADITTELSIPVYMENRIVFDMKAYVWKYETAEIIPNTATKFALKANKIVLDFEDPEEYSAIKNLITSCPNFEIKSVPWPSGF